MKASEVNLPQASPSPLPPPSSLAYMAAICGEQHMDLASAAVFVARRQKLAGFSIRKINLGPARMRELRRRPLEVLGGPRRA